MAERPILFSTPMVKAILSGNKTMTRRDKGLKEINKSPDDWCIHKNVMKNSDGDHGALFGNAKTKEEKIIKIPFGYNGDVLWVKETWAIVDRPDTPVFKAGDDGWNHDELIKDWGLKWKPSLFMSRSMCRIFLQITDIKVERLNDISEEDALSEGIDRNKLSGGWDHTPTDEFKELWESINGKGSWELNPYVWCVSFSKKSNL